MVAHVGFGEPICHAVANVLATGAQKEGATVHCGGTYICIEGPQFSTKAESRLYRQWGVDIIGMTNMPEAKLAREAELCYATLALVTDYDCWHETEDPVTVEGILATLHRNVALAKRVLQSVASAVAAVPDCACQRALQDAIITPPQQAPSAVRRKLALLTTRAQSSMKGNR
jgi:5'-methylthioadenosine phosphorylase